MISIIALPCPPGGAIHGSPRASIDRYVMNADRVADVGRDALRLLRAQADRATPVAMKEVVNRLASLALDLVNPLLLGSPD
jgi:hypothetical protein